jgi:hypothetical protein
VRLIGLMNLRRSEPRKRVTDYAFTSALGRCCRKKLENVADDLVIQGETDVEHFGRLLQARGLMTQIATDILTTAKNAKTAGSTLSLQPHCTQQDFCQLGTLVFLLAACRDR